MSNQIVISSGAKARNLSGVLTGTSGVVNSLGINVPDGIPQLDGSGKILVSQLPNSVMEFKGTWDAATNTPTLADGTGNAGDVYLCNVAGTVNFGSGPVTFAIGDQVLYSGTEWERASGATGTVTSVAVTESGDALTITGSPITTSGTINIGFAGTSGQYINGAGGLTTFPSLTGYVPYTGATANVDLGTYGLLGDYIGFNTAPTSVPTTLGTLSWDSFYRTLQLIDGDGDTTLQIGQEERILVHNNTGATLTDGQVVYVTGSTGELPSVSLADASSETTSAATLGVVTESISNGANGFITVSGLVHGLDTLAYTEGDLLWLSETAGAFTNVKPISPAHLVLIGYVIKKAGGNGSILVKIQNTQELEECSDVLFTSLANNDILAYESSTDLWKNKTIANVLGYTPANDSLVVHLAGTETITGIKTFDSGLQLASEGSGNQISLFLNTSSIHTGSTGSNIFGFNNSNNIYFGKGNSNGGVLAWNNSAVRYYNLPNADGTIALTSDLSGYLPLSGGTLTGKLTINTGGIDNQLQLNGTAPSLRLTNAVTGATINGFIAMAGTIGDYILTSAVGDMCIGNQNSGKIMFGFGSGTATAKMTIDSSGNGIFSGTLSATGGTLTGALSGTSATFSSTSTFNGTSTGVIAYFNAPTSGGTITFQTGGTSFADIGSELGNFGTGSATNLCVSARSGKDLILGGGALKTLTLASTGAATFSSSVTAGGSIETTGAYFLNGNAYFGKASSIISGGSANDGAIMVSGSNNLLFGIALSERMRITSSGNVGIGTSDAVTVRLRVKGASATSSDYVFYAENSISSLLLAARNDGAVIVGNLGTGIVYSVGGTLTSTNPSDSRLKNNIKSINWGLDEILKLRPVSYNWKDDKINQQIQFGFIAQEVKDVMPEAIKEFGDDVKYLGLEKDAIYATLVKAIQEQQAQIEELKALIAAK